MVISICRTKIWLAVLICTHREERSRYKVVTCMMSHYGMSAKNDMWKEIWNISLGLDPDAEINPFLNVATTLVPHGSNDLTM